MSRAVTVAVCLAACVSALPTDRPQTITEWYESSGYKAHTDAYKTVEELVTEKGFTYKPIDVEMSDGYVCTMFRVTDPTATEYKGPIILQHGILDSSDTWVLDEVEDSMGLLLAQDGFDVFLTNNRGNKHCKRHSKLSDSDDQFWQFTWDEMASHDIPSFVNYILALTNAEKLSYVAHSQGTTQMFAALTSQSELRFKIQDFIALAPVSYVRHSTSGLLVELSKLKVDKLLARFGMKEFLPSSSILSYALPEVCGSWATGWMCDWGMWMVTGYSWTEINRERLPVYMAHFPSGTSVLNGVHWAQGLRGEEREFKRLDYDELHFEEKNNVDVYGVPTPPQYPIQSLPMDDVEVTIFSGDLDPLSNPTDVMLMVKDLPREPEWVELKGYDHMTFLWGKNAARDIYQPVIDHLNFKRIGVPENVPEMHRQESGINGHKAVLTTFAITSSVAVAACVLVVAGSTLARRKKVSRTIDVYRASE